MNKRNYIDLIVTMKKVIIGNLEATEEGTKVVTCLEAEVAKREIKVKILEVEVEVKILPPNKYQLITQYLILCQCKYLHL